MEKILVIGAGFSKNVNYPLEKEVIPLIEKKLDSAAKIAEKFKEDLIHLWNDFFPHLDFWKLPIEEILSRVELEMKYIYARDRKRYFELTDLYEMILALFWITISAKPTKESLETLYNFLKSVGFPLVVISFNQDMVVERVCEENKISWSYIDNLRLVKQKPYLYFIKTRYNFQSYQLEHPEIKLLKLHGSFNWFYCWRCLKMRFFSIQDAGHFPSVTQWPFGGRILLCAEPKCLTKAAVGQANLMPLIIAPSALKQYDLPTIYDQFLMSRENLRNAEEIIFCGYSMREEDSLSVNLFYKLSTLNKKVKNIIVIDPNKQVYRRIANVIQFRPQYINSLHDFNNHD